MNFQSLAEARSFTQRSNCIKRSPSIGSSKTKPFKSIARTGVGTGVEPETTREMKAQAKVRQARAMIAPGIRSRGNGCESDLSITRLVSRYDYITLCIWED